MIDSDNIVTLTLTLALLTSPTYSSNLPFPPTYLSYRSYLLISLTSPISPFYQSYLSHLSYLSLLSLLPVLSISLTSLTSLFYHSAIYVLPSGYRYEDELEGKTGGLAGNQMD